MADPYATLASTHHEDLDVLDGNGEEKFGRICLPCDEPSGVEKDARAKVWVDRRPVEGCGGRSYLPAPGERSQRPRASEEFAVVLCMLAL